MSKKASSSHPAKKELEIVEEQKDPMLRALQKKVRNINKKLTEIAQLSLKKDLKPEQEEKVSKKAQIVQQKEKYTEMIEVYKEIAADNEKLLRKTQLAELEDLAGVIAIKQYGADLGPQLNQSIDSLVRILTTPTSTDVTLQARVGQILNALTASANNLKLKKNVKQFIQQNPDSKRANNQSLSDEPEPISPQSQKQRQEEIKQLEQQQQLQRKQNQVNEPLTPQVVVQHSHPAPASTSEAPNTVSEPVEQKEAPQPVEEAKESSPAPAEGVTKEENDKKPERRRENRGYQGGRRGGRDGREGREGRNYEDRKYNKKPSFKPKYEDQKQQKPRSASSSSSSSDSEPKARQFKREEVRELIEDGFIVVGKPKLKARDQKQFHDHEHGNKYHRHHTKKNY